MINLYTCFVLSGLVSTPDPTKESDHNNEALAETSQMLLPFVEVQEGQPVVDSLLHSKKALKKRIANFFKYNPKGFLTVISYKHAENSTSVEAKTTLKTQAKAELYKVFDRIKKANKEKGLAGLKPDKFSAINTAEATEAMSKAYSLNSSKLDRFNSCFIARLDEAEKVLSNYIIPDASKIKVENIELALLPINTETFRAIALNDPSVDMSKLELLSSSSNLTNKQQEYANQAENLSDQQKQNLIAHIASQNLTNAIADANMRFAGIRLWLHIRNCHFFVSDLMMSAIRFCSRAEAVKQSVLQFSLNKVIRQLPASSDKFSKILIKEMEDQLNKADPESLTMLVELSMRRVKVGAAEARYVDHIRSFYDSKPATKTLESK